MDRVGIADGLSFSQVAWGTMRVLEAEGGADAQRARLEACLAAGITTVDCADIYGGYRVEAALGEVFGADPSFRDRFEIVTKCGIQAPWGEREDLPLKHYDTSYDYVRAQVRRSREKLGTDAIDLLLIHRPDPMMDARETGHALSDVVASGEVRAVGVSNFRPWDTALLQGATDVPLVVNQIELSAGHPAPFANGDLAAIQASGMATMAWSPLGGQALTTGPVAEAARRLADAHGCTPQQVALAFLTAHPARPIPVIGTTRPDRIAAAAAVPALTRTEWFALYTAGIGGPVP